MFAILILQRFLFICSNRTQVQLTPIVQDYYRNVNSINANAGLTETIPMNPTYLGQNFVLHGQNPKSYSPIYTSPYDHGILNEK